MTQKNLNLILKKVKCILGKGKTSESKFSHIGEKNYKEKKKVESASRQLDSICQETQEKKNLLSLKPWRGKEAQP